MKRVLQIILVSICATLLLAGCNKKEKERAALAQQETVIVAKVETPVTPLYFNTSLAPLSAAPVLSDVDGRVSQLLFRYGGKITKGQKLVVLDSTQLSEEFRKSVNNYLQRKDSYENESESFRGTMALYRAGVIPKNEFLTSRSRYQNDILNYYQARYELEKILKKARIDLKSIEKLKLSDTDEINKVLERRFNDLHITAPSSGVALFPIPGGGGTSSGKGGKLAVGSQVKSGQLLLSIGDLTGFSAKVQVSEINVNRIHPGMEITIVGDAFPGIKLKGVVVSVASQAKPSQGGRSGLSMFDVSVEVPKITENERKIIRVGMSARVQIDIKEKSRVMLPIKAVTEKGGKSVVTIETATGERKQVTVVTGNTTATQVGVISGIKAGQKVVVP